MRGAGAVCARSRRRACPRARSRRRPGFRAANLDPMASGSEHLRPNLHEYLIAHSTPPDALLRDLIAETAERFPDRVTFQIGPEQGTFMTMLAGLMGARQAVEVGTFTGYSALCLARGLADGGKLLCCDIHEEWTSLARSYWPKAGRAGTASSWPGRSSAAPGTARTAGTIAARHLPCRHPICNGLHNADEDAPDQRKRGGA